MVEVVDGRKSAGIGTVSKRRFTERVKRHAKRAIYKSIEEGNITDISEKGVDVSIERDDISEPQFHHGKGGLTRRVLPGNKTFQNGDRIMRPQGGDGSGGSGQEAGDGSGGEDDFVFHLSREEFLDLLFDDLGLPNMRRLNTQDSLQTKRKYDGLAASGQMSQMDRKRSKRLKLGRVLAAETPYNREIAELLREACTVLSAYDQSPRLAAQAAFGIDTWTPLRVECKQRREELSDLKTRFLDLASPNEQARIRQIEEEIVPREEKKSLIPQWNKATDMKFRHFSPHPIPENKAVMFCIMDVSGSMDEEKKTNAKLFFFLLHTFLKRNHSSVDVVFIRHHTEAKEVDEQDFFYGRDTGGTLVSPALQMVDDIARSRYLGKNYDVYMAQASDGDNLDSDNPKCDELMRSILGYARGGFYTEITKDAPQNLWHTYEAIAKDHADNFSIGRIEQRGDIWPIFRTFFARKYSFDTPSSLKASSTLSFA